MLILCRRSDTAHTSYAAQDEDRETKKSDVFVLPAQGSVFGR